MKIVSGRMWCNVNVCGMKGQQTDRKTDDIMKVTCLSPVQDVCVCVCVCDIERREEIDR